MHLHKPLMGVLTLLAFTTTAFAQTDRAWLDRPLTPTYYPSRHHLPGDSPAVRRWTLSLNPLGLLEAPTAIGIGIGYRVSPHWELWSETSLLARGYYTAVSQIRGFRETFQARWFPIPGKACFIGLDLRYKSYSFNSVSDFYNTQNNDTLLNRAYHEDHSFWAVGLTAGWRRKLTHNGRLQLEITAGIGFKYKTLHWPGIGDDYRKQRKSIDLNVNDFLNSRGATAYVPGSIRLIWTFGKRIL